MWTCYGWLKVALRAASVGVVWLSGYSTAFGAAILLPSAAATIYPGDFVLAPTPKDSDPAIASGGNGVWVAIWASDLPLPYASAGYNILSATSQDSGATWQSPILIDHLAHTPAHGYEKPSLATDGQGTWVAVWADSHATDLDVRSAYSLDNGATWSQAVFLHMDAVIDTKIDSNPAIAADHLGNFAVVWEGYESAPVLHKDIYASHSADGGKSWAVPNLLTPGTPTGRDPDIHVDSEGNWTLAWGNSAISIRQSVDGGRTWEGNTAIAPLGYSASFNHFLTAHDSSDWLLIYDAYSSTQRKVYISRSADAAVTWTTPALVDPLDYAPSATVDRNPAAAVDGMGNWVAIWGGRDSPDRIRILRDNGGVQEPMDLAIPLGGTSSHFDLDTDKAGNWIAVWDFAYSNGGWGSSNVYYTRFSLDPPDPSPLTVLNVTPATTGPTDSDSISFTVNFSEPVTGFDGAEDVLVSLADATFQGVSISGAGANYNVTLAGVDGEGALNLTVRLDSDIVDAEGYHVASAPTSDPVLIDNHVPLVTINQDPGQTDPAYLLPVLFNVEFSEDVRGFDPEDIVQAGTATGVQFSISGGPKKYLVLATHSGTAGTIAPEVIPDISLVTPNEASTSTDNVVQYDPAQPRPTLPPAAYTGPLAPSPDNSTLSNSAPQLATDGSGIWMLMWRHGHSSTSASLLFSRSFDNGGSWTASEVIVPAVPISGTVPLAPMLATNRQGTWITAWGSKADIGNGDEGDLWFSRSTNAGSSWSEPALLNSTAFDDNSAYDDSYPTIAADGAGNWIIAWQSNFDLVSTRKSSSDILYTRSSDDGITWSAAAKLSHPYYFEDDSNDLHPHIATDRNGRWVAVWYAIPDLANQESISADILFSVSVNNGATWRDSGMLNKGPVADDHFDSSPKVAVDCGQNWIATWVGRSSNIDENIFVSHSTNGANWDEARLLNHSAGVLPHSDEAQSHVATDALGNWVALWNHQSVANRIEATWSTNNGSAWTYPTSLGIFGYTSSSPVIATDGMGTWMAAWQSTYEPAPTAHSHSIVTTTFQLPENETPCNAPLYRYHHLDTDTDHVISVTELLRAIQFFNAGGLHCYADELDGYATGAGSTDCAPHDLDYQPQDWVISLSELLRAMQLFNYRGYSLCLDVDAPTEDGFCAG